MLFFQLLSSSSKHHGDGTDSEKSSLSVLLEHTVAAMEKFMRKRKKPVTTDSTTPLEVVHEHPVLISTLALLLHQNPQLVSARYTMFICVGRAEAAVNNYCCMYIDMQKSFLSYVAQVKRVLQCWLKNLMHSLSWYVHTCRFSREHWIKSG